MHRSLTIAFVLVVSRGDASATNCNQSRHRVEMARRVRALRRNARQDAARWAVAVRWGCNERGYCGRRKSRKSGAEAAPAMRYKRRSTAAARGITSAQRVESEGTPLAERSRLKTGYQPMWCKRHELQPVSTGCRDGTQSPDTTRASACATTELEAGFRSLGGRGSDGMRSRLRAEAGFRS